MSDAAMFTDAFRRWHGPIRGWLYNVTSDYGLAEEIAAETFVRAWAAWPRLEHERHITPWLWKICRNLLRDVGRARYRHYHKDLVDMDEAEAIPSPHDELVAAERWIDVQTAWAYLTPGQRDALALAAAGYGQRDARAKLGITPLAYRLRLHRGRETLIRHMR